MIVEMLNYFIESSIALAVLYLLYFLLFRQYKNFLFNRSYLILSMIFAVTLPILDVSFFMSNAEFATINIQQAILMPSIAIREGSEAIQSNRSEYSFFGILGFLYGLGAIGLGIRFMIRFGRLISFIRSHSTTGIFKKGYTVIYTAGKIATCSFFNYLLWDDSQEYSEEETKVILEHEKTHIRHRHSYDILFAELLIIIFWFNPVVYLYRNSLSAVHEYMADQNAAALTSPSGYISLLSLKTLKSLNLSIGNNFHQTQIFNRMTMLKREKKRSWWSRIALTTPVFAILFYVFACGQQDEALSVAQTSAGLPEGMTLVSPESVSPEVKAWYEESMRGIAGFRKVDDTDFYLVNLEKWNKNPVEGSNIQIHLVRVNKKADVGEQIYAIVEKSDKFLPQEEIKKKIAEGEEFPVVDEHPIFPGGTQEFYNYITQNIKYPEEAKTQNITGKVYVEFVVSKDGSIADVQVLKGIGGGCDQEAVRVIQNLPKWTPGKHGGDNVKVKMVLPIEFSLNESAKTEQE